jgi:hypothetical protein
MDKDKDNYNYAHLLANPFFMKNKKDKTKSDNNLEIQDELTIILNKLFPDYNMNENDHNLIFEKIEKICREILIDKTVVNVVDTIISDIIKDGEIQKFSIETING